MNKNRKAKLFMTWTAIKPVLPGWYLVKQTNWELPGFVVVARGRWTERQNPEWLYASGTCWMPTAVPHIEPLALWLGPIGPPR